MAIPFIKMHGCGNDFVVLDELAGAALPAQALPQAVRRLCSRRFGIGADQLIVIGRGRQAPWRMDIYNADGSRVEMCGNALRCAAAHLVYAGHAAGPSLSLETLSGTVIAEVLPEAQVRIDMGQPRLEAAQCHLRDGKARLDEFCAFGEGGVFLTTVSMGNPHAVIFYEDLAEAPVHELGPVIECDPLFQKRTNVEFVQVLDERTLVMRVWERGAGETLACGSGACAAAVAAILTGRCVPGTIEVRLRGGSLSIAWDGSGAVHMSGPAERLYAGVWEAELSGPLV